MQRAALEILRSVRQRQCWQNLARARGTDTDALSVNHFRKQRRVGGCGHARCWLCHADKLAQRPSPRTRRASDAWADSLRSLDPARRP
jgi:hypothetical protein